MTAKYELAEIMARAAYKKRMSQMRIDHPRLGLRELAWDELPADFKRLETEQAHAALVELERDGFVIVPTEPTIEMCDAATRATSAFLHLEQRGVDLRRLKHAIRYRAMIAERPRP